MLPWDGVLNLLAALGTAGFALHLWRPVRAKRGLSPVEVRFAILASIIAVFLALRGLYWLSDQKLFLTMSQLFVAAVPLGVLLCLEGLMRRHAPVFLKLFPSLGLALCVAMTFVAPPESSRLASTYYAGFQLFGLALPFSWAFLRNRSELSPRENRRLDVLILLCAVGLPFIATDFSDLVPSLPVRLGAIVMLMFAHTAVLVARYPTRMSVPFWRLFNLAVGSLCLAGVLVWLTALSGEGMFFRLTVLILTVGTLLSLGLEILSLRDQSEERGLLRVMAALDMSRPEAVVARLTRFTPFEHAILVKPGQRAIPSDLRLSTGTVYQLGQEQLSATHQRAAAVLDALGMELLFALDKEGQFLCAVPLSEPAANTRDWANVLAKLAASQEAKG